MPYKPKGRVEIQTRLNAKRKKVRKSGFDGPVILLGAKGGMTRKKILQVLNRLKEKKETRLREKIPYISSSDNIMMRKGIRVSATDMTMRLSQSYLMKGLEYKKLNQTQKRIVEEIISHRTQTIPGTNIQLRPPTEFMFLRLANSFGKNGSSKAKEVLKHISERARNISKMSQKIQKESDAFLNIYPKIDSLHGVFSLWFPKGITEKIPSVLKERVEELDTLRTLNIPNKEVFVKKIEKEIQNTKEEYIQYLINNSAY
ncbi:MAG: hypothetical protein WC462_02465 [archaeon]